MEKVRSLILLLSVFLLFHFPGHLYGSPTIIFDTVQYDKGKGKPVVYTSTFSADDASTQCTLHVWQGEDGENMAKNGSIALNGELVVSKKELRKGTGYISKLINIQLNNVMTVELKGKGGVFLKVKITRDTGPNDLSITISSPLDGETVNRETVMVWGSFNSLSNEASVMVNDKLAEVSGNSYFANNIPLIVGQNTISAMIIEPGGYKAAETITIQTDTRTQPVRLSSNITSGVSPLTVYFTLDTNIPHPITSYQMDYDGDGNMDYTADNADDISYIYNISGLYLAQALVTDDKGNQYGEQISINVIPQEELDALLKSKWSGMVNALMDEDMETALTYFSERSRPKYEQGFNLLMDQLPDIFSLPEEFNLVSIKDNIAIYENIVQVDGVSRSYPVMFIKDENGFWKIRGF